MHLINLFDFEEKAHKKLPTPVWDYYSSGAHDEITLRENRAAYDKICLRYRVLVDVSERYLSTKVLGHTLSMPVIVAPMAFQAMAHPEGELATVRAVGGAGTIMIASTLSNFSIEQIMQAASGPVWFQLYIYKDRSVTKSLVERAEKAGCAALVVTVDLPVSGRRERDVRNRFALPKGLQMGNFGTSEFASMPKPADQSGLTTYASALFDPSVSWKDIEWLKSITKLPILLKGIVRGDDAKAAVESGVSGIVVSNHGGRQLDTAPATIEVLQEVAEAVDGRAELLVDGGIRRGTDVVKAIALGAKAVLVGRPILWGLVNGGGDGVAQVLDILRAEIDQAMALCGCASVNEISLDLIGERVAVKEVSLGK
ncbi:MAG: alpha-hydroxy-acid oxidizing protein [Candidatus Obscuribacterales bacterium]|nr:alpha-hydroxy-acid oxidizing protein [Candidatus Obscuribacterales bacterium]